MAITTYDELRAATLDWLNRADLAPVFDTFLALAEAEMRIDVRLRGTQAIDRSTLVITGQYTPLPAAFDAFLSVDTAAAPYIRPQPVMPAEIDLLRTGYTVPGVPSCARYYAIVGDQIEVFPVPAAPETWNIAFWTTLPALGFFQPTNWLLQAQPGIYLNAVLKQTAPYLKEDERVATWGAAYERLAEAFKVSEDTKRLSAAPVRIRTRTLG